MIELVFYILGVVAVFGILLSTINKKSDALIITIIALFSWFGLFFIGLLAYFDKTKNDNKK